MKRDLAGRRFLPESCWKGVESVVPKRPIVVFVLSVITCLLVTPAHGDQNVDIVVKTILASQESEYLDPQLSSLVEELRSVFRYSSYRLLSEDSTNLGIGKTRDVSLPGKRILKITPIQVTGDRVELQLVILKKKNKIFETDVKLLNKSSLTVGGPQYEDGYLLFNISAAF